MIFKFQQQLDEEAIHAIYLDAAKRRVLLTTAVVAAALGALLATMYVMVVGKVLTELGDVLYAANGASALIFVQLLPTLLLLVPLVVVIVMALTFTQPIVNALDRLIGKPVAKEIRERVSSQENTSVSVMTAEEFLEAEDKETHVLRLFRNCFGRGTVLVSIPILAACVVGAFPQVFGVHGALFFIIATSIGAMLISWPRAIADSLLRDIHQKYLKMLRASPELLQFREVEPAKKRAEVAKYEAEKAEHEARRRGFEQPAEPRERKDSEKWRDYARFKEEVVPNIKDQKDRDAAERFAEDWRQRLMQQE